jgi:hypothetical protein
MKRPFSLLLLLVLMFAVAGCGAAEEPTPTAALPEATDVVPVEEPTPAGEAYPAPVLPTLTPLPEGYPEPSTPPPAPTLAAYPAPEEEAPAAPELSLDRPPAGLVFEDSGGLWRLNAEGDPERLSTRTGLEPSPDLTRAAYIEGDDVFVLDLASGEAENITEGSGRAHYFVIWWPARPDTLILGSQGEEDIGPNNGRLTLVDASGNGYEVVAEEVSFAFPEGDPDGSRIAYDEAGQPYIYDVDNGIRTPFDPAAFELPEGVTVQRAASPAWSPDGGSLAFMMGILRDDGPEQEEIALGVFDLDAGTAQVIHSYVTLGRGGWFQAPRWSPDGQWLTFPVETGDDERGLWLSAADGSREQLIGGNAFATPVWHASANALAFSPDDPQNTLLLAAAPTWEPQSVGLPHTRLISWE